jgi:hypothetical protein
MAIGVQCVTDRISRVDKLIFGRLLAIHRQGPFAAPTI